MPAGVVFCEFDGAFDRVAPRRPAEHDVARTPKAPGSDLSEAIDEVETGFRRKIDRVRIRPQLLLNALQNVGVRVTDVQHADTREEVEERVAIDVADRRAASLLECDRHSFRVRDGAAVDLSLSLEQPFGVRSRNHIDRRCVREVQLFYRGAVYHSGLWVSQAIVFAPLSHILPTILNVIQ